MCIASSLIASPYDSHHDGGPSMRERERETEQGTGVVQTRCCAMQGASAIAREEYLFPITNHSGTVDLL